MTPHGEHNPPAIDPADYPYRGMIQGNDPDAATVIAWFDRDPLPFDDDFASSVAALLAAGGHVLVLAKSSDVLARTQAAVCMLGSEPGVIAS